MNEFNDPGSPRNVRAAHLFLWRSVSDLPIPDEDSVDNEEEGREISERINKAIAEHDDSERQEHAEADAWIMQVISGYDAFARDHSGPGLWPQQHLAEMESRSWELAQFAALSLHEIKRADISGEDRERIEERLRLIVTEARRIAEHVGWIRHLTGGVE